MKAVLDIVIVTFNRLEKLKKTLRCYEAQSESFRNLIVVDNCSTDGTKDFLKLWSNNYSINTEIKKFNPIIISNKENLGGSGGFYIGQLKAMALEADWVFVADDDAYAEVDMVERFYDYLQKHDTTHTAAICSAVYNIDGSISLSHRDRNYSTKRIETGVIAFFCRQYIRENVPEHEYMLDHFSIDLFSYVGTFMNGKALKKVGLVDKTFFIYYDDSEHSLRMKKYGDIIVVPGIRITHEGGGDKKNNNAIDWRVYYSTRNEQRMILKHYPRTALWNYYILLRCTIGTWLHHPKTTICEQIMRIAMWDALFCRMGKHSLYKPGWKIMNENLLH